MEHCPNETLIEARNKAMERFSLARDLFPELPPASELVDYSCNLSACKVCGGMSVDLSSGELHCGLLRNAALILKNQIHLQELNLAD